jgi:RNA polymerase sigma-70 factor (ECF subfamily)
MTKTPSSLLERLHLPFDPEAWDRFVSLYTPLIYNWGRRVGMQDQDAADLVQEVFVKLIQVLPTFDYDRHRGFRGWLRTVTLNTWRDRLKHRRDQPMSPDQPPLAELAGMEGQESFWDAEYRQQIVKRAISLMQSDFQPATWRAFWEQVVDGRAARDVASQLGLTRGAAYAAKLRVLSRLRQELNQMLD